jgi:molybdopterin converting factor small subunit
MAEVRVEFTGPFRDICKCSSSSLTIDGDVSLLALVRRLGDIFGDAFERKLGLRDDGYDEDSVMVVLNGLVVESPRLRSTTVRPGDHVVFAPSLASGG